MPYRSATVPGHGELHRSRTHRDLVLRARQRVTAPTDCAARRERAVLGIVVADPGAAPGLQAYETCLALCVPALALGEGLEPSMSRATTGGLTFWLPEIVAGTDGIEPSSSGLQPDAGTVSASFPNTIPCGSSHSDDGDVAPIVGACETGPTARRIAARRARVSRKSVLDERFSFQRTR